eukprot:COSAG01_NODE_2433_length_7703_cov_64.622173_2_plen_140_part_00
MDRSRRVLYMAISYSYGQYYSSGGASTSTSTRGPGMLLLAAGIADPFYPDPPAGGSGQRNRIIASAGSSSKMTAECEAQPQNSPGALNMPLPGTAQSSNPFGGCAMAMREPGQLPPRGGVPPRAGRLSQGGRRRLWPSR